jgi:WD40 repeat protein
VSYKQIFSLQYPVAALGGRPINSAVVPRSDGTVELVLNGLPTSIPLVDSATPCTWSTLIFPRNASATISTDDSRYRAAIVQQEFETHAEYWIEHTDWAAGRSHRVKLSAVPGQSAGWEPALAISPRGHYIITDDDGTVRLYAADTMIPAGAFQVSHVSTDNRITALAITPDETIVAALSSWKDVVLYSITERKIIFVRQVRDPVGWYDQGPGMIGVAQEGIAILAVGIGIPRQGDEPAGPVISVSGFRRIQRSVSQQSGRLTHADDSPP